MASDVRLKGSLGCSDYEMLEVRILREWNKANSKVTALDISRGNFRLFRVWLGSEQASGRAG